uniref:Uncharacterized protein n=1 Tax=Arundo donax TaxID=35708 RepID=A0A0A9EWE8_ARUDO
MPHASILPSTKGQIGYTQGGQPKTSFLVILLIMYLPSISSRIPHTAMVLFTRETLLF